MENPYRPPEAQFFPQSSAPATTKSNPLGLLCFATLSIAASWATFGQPFITLGIIACVAVVVSFFIPRRDLRSFVWFGISALAISVVGTRIFIRLQYGAADSYASSERIGNAFDVLAAFTIPCGAILGTTCGVMYSCIRHRNRHADIVHVDRESGDARR